MKYLTGKNYHWLCERCRATVDSVVSLVIEGPDTDDDEAPINFVYDNGLYCGGYTCVNRPEEYDE